MAAHRAVAWGLAATGECKQARFHTAAALVHAEKLGERWWLTSTSFSNELLCLYEGDWQAAREMSELGLVVDPRDPRHLALRAVLECELGDHDAGATYITQLREVAEGMPSPGPIADDVFLAAAVPLVGRIAGDQRLDVARAAAERVLLVPRLAPVLALNATCGLALIAVQRGDADAAERLYDNLASQSGAASFFIPLTIDRLLGLLAVTSGRVEEAVGHFEDGLEFCKRAGYRPEYAWTASDYADMLLGRAASDDHAKALALQDEALEISRELDMRALAERVLGRGEADAYSKTSRGSSADTSG
jgi:tetratricopeptide (TPR) repeat protein